MLELGLFVLKFDDLLVELISVPLDSVLLLLYSLQLVFVLVFCILDGLVQLLGALLLPSELLLGVPQRCFCLGHPLTDFLTEVNIADPLLHHEIDRVDCVLHIFWLSSEYVSDCRHTIALLRLLDIFQVVHQP